MGRVGPLPNLQRLESLGQRGIRLGLSAIDAVCERLGRPERAVPGVLVAGTNGKGSTAATLDAIASAAGLRTGLYTSPHLMAVTERIRVGGDDVSPEALDAALGGVFAAADRAPAVPLTYFEAMTAAAFAIFAKEALELAVLEVGLGGRHDATNVAPAGLSLVTSIGYDHMADLGPTLDAIAREKAGVFRRGKPALFWADADEARSALAEAALAAGARLHEADREIRLGEVGTDLAGTRFHARTPLREYALATPLPGAHQARNAALAVRAAELLAEGEPRIGEEAIRSGVARVRWPGRLERFRVGEHTVLLDGCHNAEGAAALARFLEDASLRASLIFGVMADKQVEEIGRLLLPRVARVWFTAPANERAVPPEELRRRLGGLAPDSTAASVGAALDAALSGRAGEPIIVAGSLYLVGEARGLLLSRGNPDGATRG
ncbi:MAG TPA: folylpolyglutamate synthase/dihydrofolate synthase family protein [Thermoanaerobaculia bacterium]